MKSGDSRSYSPRHNRFYTPSHKQFSHFEPVYRATIPRWRTSNPGQPGMVGLQNLWFAQMTGGREQPEYDVAPEACRATIPRCRICFWIHESRTSQRCVPPVNRQNNKDLRDGFLVVEILHAPDQTLHRKWFHQVLYFVLVQETGDMWLRRKSGDEDEVISQLRPNFSHSKVKLVTT